jgi:hypothetical protein
MIPNILIHEQLVRERHKPRQREAEQKRMLVGLHPHRLPRRLLGRPGLADLCKQDTVPVVKTEKRGIHVWSETNVPCP